MTLFNIQIDWCHSFSYPYRLPLPLLDPCRPNERAGGFLCEDRPQKTIDRFDPARLWRWSYYCSNSCAVQDRRVTALERMKRTCVRLLVSHVERADLRRYGTDVSTLRPRGKEISAVTEP